MRKIQRLFWLGLLVALLPGCSTTTVTNLTPSRLPRKESGNYPFSVEYRTRQSTILHDTFRAYVVAGNERYAMEQTPFLTNRWETLVPIPATDEVLHYFYRFEYDYKAIPVIKQAVRDSDTYRLIIEDN